MPKQPFFEKTWFAILMLFIFAPIGIFLIWKYDKFNKFARISLSILFGLTFLIAVIPTDSDDVATDTSTAPEEATVEAEPEAEPEPELTAEEQAELDAQAAAEAEAKAKEEAEAKAKAEAEAKKKAEEEAKAKAEEEQRKKEEAEAAAKAKEEAYANSQITYKQLEKGADKYVGEPVRFTGEVLEIQEDADGAILRVAVVQDSYGYDYNSFILVYTDVDTSEIYQEDIVTVDGTVFGDYTYESQAGWNITAPFITGEKVYK